MFLSVINKNLNWKIVTKNLVTFERWDLVKNEKFKCYVGSLKKCNFYGGHEKPIYRGRFPKKGAWTVCKFKGGLVKKRRWCFLRMG